MELQQRASISSLNICPESFRNGEESGRRKIYTNELHLPVRVKIKKKKEFQQHQHKHYRLGGQNIFRWWGKRSAAVPRALPCSCVKLGGVTGRVHADVGEKKTKTTNYGRPALLKFTEVKTTGFNRCSGRKERVRMGRKTPVKMNVEIWVAVKKTKKKKSVDISICALQPRSCATLMWLYCFMRVKWTVSSCYARIFPFLSFPFLYHNNNQTSISSKCFNFSNKAFGATAAEHLQDIDF